MVSKNVMRKPLGVANDDFFFFILVSLLARVFIFKTDSNKYLICRKVKYLQLGICTVTSTRAALQQKAENMYLMM